MQENLLDDKQMDEKSVNIGRYKLTKRLIDFVSVKGNINFITNRATIEGNQLSGLELDGITFKLEICDEGTVNFDEVDTDVTTFDMRGRLLETILEKTITPFRDRMVVNELTFKTLDGDFKDKLNCYISVDYEKPYNRLVSLFDTPDVTLTEEQSSKLDSLMSLFDDDNDTINEDIIEVNSSKIEIESFDKDIDKSYLEDSFNKMRKEKVLELKESIEKKKKDLSKFTWEKTQSEKRIKETNSDIELLSSRLEKLEPSEPYNGYFYNVSEEINETISLDSEVQEFIYKKVSKVKGINVEAFMKIFSSGEYHISIAKKLDNNDFEDISDYSKLEPEILEKLSSLELTIEDNKIVYRGDLKWHDLNGTFIKMGFEQNPEFDKKCNSNSFGNQDDELLDTKTDN